VQAQPKLLTPGPTPADRMGIPANLTQSQLQQDVFKELINKFAWALGSTYRRSSTQRRSNVRLLARQLATAVIESEGYPGKIARDFQVN